MKKSKQERARVRIAVARARKQYASTMVKRYYLTFVKRDCRCKACGRKLRTGADQMVYRKQGDVTLCVPCADADPLVTYRLSEKVERSLIKAAR
jgi:hypothetical protein